MIKKIREGAIDKPIVLKIIMGVIAAAFAFSLGWGGFQSRSAASNTIVARVNGVPISKGEYKRSYRNAYDSYRDIFKDKFDEKMIEQLDLRNNILNSLINREVWVFAAEDMGIKVSKQEIKDQIMEMKSFYDNDKFSPTRYKKLLAANRIKPKEFESSIRSEISVNKAQAMVKASVQLTPGEITKALEGKKDISDDEKEKLKENLLTRKQERATMGYLESQKKTMKIEKFL